MAHGHPRDWKPTCIHRKAARHGSNRVFRLDGPEGTLAAKVNDAPEVNRSQMAALEALLSATDGIVRPLGLGPGDAFFLMPWVEGRLLSDVLWGPESASATDAAAQLGEAGKLLRRLQDATRRPVRSDDLAGDFTLETPTDDGPDIAALAARISEAMPRHWPSDGEIVRLHGDFQARNIFQTAKGLLAFDSPRPREGHAFFDAARFCLMLDLHLGLAAAAGGRTALSPSRARIAFFEGYGAVPARSLPVFDMIEDLVGLRLWRQFRRGEPGQRRDRHMTALFATRPAPGAREARPARLVRRWTGRVVALGMDAKKAL
jgi:hypothetical protein